MNSTLSSDPFVRFRSLLEERNREKDRQKIADIEISQKKDEELIPVRQLLKQMVDMNILVSNSARFAGGTKGPDIAPKSFRGSKNKPAPPYLPGNSLYIDHPANLEIAVPNQLDKDTKGVVVIHCSTEHPKKYLLNGPFHTMQEACLALAEFIAASTEHAVLD